MQLDIRYFITNVYFRIPNIAINNDGSGNTPKF